MMISKKALLIMAVAGMIFSFTSCKKAEEPVKPAGTQTETNVQAEVPVVILFAEESATTPVVITDWKKEDVNALLMFVPVDFLFVFGSIREIDLNYLIVQRGFNIYSQSVDKYIALMN